MTDITEENTQDIEPDNSEVTVTIRLTAEENKQLNDSAIRSCRTKAKEAKLRLIDHLSNFSTIASEGYRYD